MKLKLLYGVFLLYVSLGRCPVAAGLNAQGNLDAVNADDCLSVAPTGLRAPVAPKRVKLLTTAAGTVLDEYHWLRDDSHSNPEVLGYLTAENAYADAALEQLQPLAAKLAAEMGARSIDSSAPLPVRRGLWWYYERRQPGQHVWRRYRRHAQLQQPHTSGDNENTNSVHDSHAASTSGSSVWSESWPVQDQPEQLVLDPDLECDQVLALATKSSAQVYAIASSGDASSSPASSNDGAQHCEVYGSTVSPDGQFVAFGVDIAGSEQYQLMVRDIASGASLLPSPISNTSGDYEWSADSRALFFVTRNGTTNRPCQVWYVSLHTILEDRTPASAEMKPLLLWQEANAAFYLTLSRSSSGRFLLLSSASEVTRQVLLLDLESSAAQPPSSASWLSLAARRHGVKQQMVGHWQSWLFLLLVSPETPNGALLVAPVHAPDIHTVLLPHRREVELEDVRIFAHHLVLAERQLGHTTITVYCLPADTSAAALAACRYNSTAASAAEAQAEAAAQATMKRVNTAADGSSVTEVASTFESESSRLQHSNTYEFFSNAGVAADVAVLEAASKQQLDVADALPLLDRGAATSQPDAHHTSGMFVVIRGRAGSEQVQGSSSTFDLLDPSVAVEEQQQANQVMADARGGTAAAPLRRQVAEVLQTQRDLTAGQADAREHTDASNKLTGHKFGLSSPPYMRFVQRTSVVASKNDEHTASAAAPPVLSAENSWQVTFEEDAYSVSIMDSGDWAASTLRLAYTSFTTPHTVLDIDMRTQRRTVRSVEAVGGGFRSSDYRSYRLWATAADGVEVPMSLVYRLDSFGRDGNNPALLMVYGAYGTKYDPEWDSRLLSLLDRGWVVGIVHVRGGGELGYGWHAAGRLDAKTNSFNDLLAAAATLVQHNLTSASRLAVWGRSAGGLTAAAAINSAPGMFHAALLDVPFLDVLGDLVDAGLPLTVKEWDEWGDPLRNATQAALITSYSPVHNVRQRVRYPHMLVTAGLMDKRVGYWEAAKWVAQLRAAVADIGADSTGRSIQQHEPYSSSALGEGGSIGDQQPGYHHLLLHTDMSGGHFSSVGLGSSLDAAFQYAFLIGTLPSCGSPLGLTGPDVQQTQRQTWQQRADGSSTVPVGRTSIHGLTAAFEALPGPLHQLLVGLLALVVTAGLMTVLWQASRVWWPLAVSPADLQATLDAASCCIEPCTPGSKLAVKAGTKTSSCSSKVKTRRTSTANTNTMAGDWQQQHQQQRLSVSMGETAPLLTGCLSPAPHACSPARRDAQLCSPTPSRPGQSPQQQWQLQQHALVFGGLMDDWLLELTSAVPDAVSGRPGLVAGGTTSGPQGPLLSRFLSAPGSGTTSSTCAYNCPHHQQYPQQLPPLCTQCSTSIGSSSNAGNTTGLFLRAERRTSTGV